MKTWVILMLLSTGEIVHSDVEQSYCLEYVEHLKRGELPVMDEPGEAVVIAAVCGPSELMKIPPKKQAMN